MEDSLEKPVRDGSCSSPVKSVFTGPVYVVRDNIDTDQIIPAQYLNLVPTIAEEYEKLGSYAMWGLPELALPATRFVEDPANWTRRLSDHRSRAATSAAAARASTPPSRIGSANCAASSWPRAFARIFFRNCVSTGELYPCEIADRLCEHPEDGRRGDGGFGRGHGQSCMAPAKRYSFKPLGDVRPVVDAGGLFNYARSSGMIG